MEKKSTYILAGQTVYKKKKSGMGNRWFAQEQESETVKMEVEKTILKEMEPVPELSTTVREKAVHIKIENEAVDKQFVKDVTAISVDVILSSLLPMGISLDVLTSYNYKDFSTSLAILYSSLLLLHGVALNPYIMGSYRETMRLSSPVQRIISDLFLWAVLYRAVYTPSTVIFVCLNFTESMVRIFHTKSSSRIFFTTEERFLYTYCPTLMWIINRGYSVVIKSPKMDDEPSEINIPRSMVYRVFQKMLLAFSCCFLIFSQMIAYILFLVFAFFPLVKGKVERSIHVTQVAIWFNYCSAVYLLFYTCFVYSMAVGFARCSFCDGNYCCAEDNTLCSRHVQVGLSACSQYVSNCSTLTNGSPCLDQLKNRFDSTDYLLTIYSAFTAASLWYTSIVYIKADRGLDAEFPPPDEIKNLA